MSTVMLVKYHTLTHTYVRLNYLPHWHSRLGHMWTEAAMTVQQKRHLNYWPSLPFWSEQTIASDNQQCVAFFDKKIIIIISYILS